MSARLSGGLRRCMCMGKTHNTITPFAPKSVRHPAFFRDVASSSIRESAVFAPPGLTNIQAPPVGRSAFLGVENFYSKGATLV
jgi:hypothetical protein